MRVLPASRYKCCCRIKKVRHIRRLAVQDKRPGKSTSSVWGGEDEYLMQNATQVPVVHSVSFGYSDLEHWQKVALGEQKGHIYSRNSNPTVDVFENKVRQLENAEAVTSAATG